METMTIKGFYKLQLCKGKSNKVLNLTIYYSSMSNVFELRITKNNLTKNKGVTI